jgi:hypothetical protein
MNRHYVEGRENGHAWRRRQHSLDERLAEVKRVDARLAELRFLVDNGRTSRVNSVDWYVGYRAGLLGLDDWEVV